MAEAGAAAGQTETAVFEVFIRGTVDAVWREITKTDEIQQAFFNSRMCTPGLEVGAPIQMRTPDGKNVSVVGEVTEYDPPRVLAHTMRFTHLDDPESTVRYELVEQDGGVKFTLTILEMPAGTKTAKAMKQGGPMIVNTLKGVVENGKPPLLYRIMGAIFKLFPVPKKCNVEHWRDARIDG